MDTLLRFLSSGRGGPCSRPGGVSDLIKEEAVPISPRASIDVLLKERKVWRRMAQLLLLQMLGLRKKIFERKRLNHFQCCDLELKIKMLMFANIILVGISDSYFLRCSVNGSVFFNNALICYMMILFGFYGLASSASVVIGGKLCQETSGHGRKPDEPHNFGAPKELMERVHVSSTGHQRLPADPNGLTTLEERMERVHVSSTGIHQRERPTLHKRPPSRGQQQQSHISDPKLVFGLPRRPELDVSQCCNDNVLPSPPDPMMSCRCYHPDGKHVCVPKAFPTPSNPDKKHFYLDSGACFHMTGNPLILQRYPDNMNITPPIQFVYGANGSPLRVCGCGYINTDGIKLDHVLYVPGLIANLVSVGQLASVYSVRTVFDRNLFSIEKLLTGERIGQGHREGNLYVLDHFLPS